MNRLTHEQLVNKLHVNKYEHRDSIYKFMQVFFMSGFLGLFIGGLFDYIVRHAEGTEPSKPRCFGYLTLQFAFTGLFFYFALLYKRGISFDDWMMSTFAGFIFALSFFTVQQTLTNNMLCLFTE